MKYLLEKISISGKSAYPIIEGGKGISISTGSSAGAWANAGAVGTLSATNANWYDENGNVIPLIFHGKTRQDRHEELVEYSINGGFSELEIARRISSDGVIHINVLWEAAATQRILKGILDIGSKKGCMPDGITSGAGMPYNLAKIAESYNVYYYPIVSSARAFKFLFLRSYRNHIKYLGGVVYEDPWLAGGHNGISSREDPNKPEDPMPRIIELRDIMNEYGLHDVMIIMAGGVWHLNDWKHWINNPKIGKIGFQFGTRALLTKESQISDGWKEKLLEGNIEVSLNRFSPTGFYSSAIRNNFLKELEDREKSSIEFSRTKSDKFKVEFKLNNRTTLFLKEEINIPEGYIPMISKNTLIFVTKDKRDQIKKDQEDCMGCLSACRFSGWHEDGSVGTSDPKSFCIQKTLRLLKDHWDIENELVFSGKLVNMFSKDKAYINGRIPTTKELLNLILIGE